MIMAENNPEQGLPLDLESFAEPAKQLDLKGDFRGRYIVFFEVKLASEAVMDFMKDVNFSNDTKNLVAHMRAGIGDVFDAISIGIGKEAIPSMESAKMIKHLLDALNDRVKGLPPAEVQIDLSEQPAQLVYSLKK